MATVQEALDRIWSDAALKRSLLANPKPVLNQLGMDIADNVTVEIHENTPGLINVVLPAKPAEPGSLNTADPVARLIEHAWQNPAVKAKLLNDPKEAAAENGIRLPDSVEVKVWENTATVQHLVLPVNPSSTELSDADLEAVAGGSGSVSKTTGVSACQPTYFVNTGVPCPIYVDSAPLSQTTGSANPNKH
jgi:hypothetical protein